YDSVIYTLKLTNPAPDPSVPDFHITFRCYDGQYWQYISNMVVYTIKTATAPTTSLAVVASPGTTASGTTATMQSAGIASQPASTIQSQSAFTTQSASVGQPSTVQTAAGLQWTTENEQGVASYQVMESLDGVNYQPIATVNAKCNDSSKCTYFLPATPDPTRVTHYKVTVTTQDSATSETNTVKLGEDIASRISLFPNPARDFVNFTYNSPDDAGDANLLIYDIQGKVLQKRPFTIHAGPNILYINLAGMPKGIYMAGLQFGLNTAVVKRFVIQN
ncbi:MAG: T9SS type A sorting domain-containing protein, partial [Bacteroidetes bacterium]|nr:T9SS type A sorting domain-containing protein [Bacteroidota bacterium]